MYYDVIKDKFYNNDFDYHFKIRIYYLICWYEIIQVCSFMESTGNQF